MYISIVELSKCRGISFTNRRNRTGPRIDPVLPLAWQTVFAPPDMIETKPWYLGWRRALIISLLVNCDLFYGNQQNNTSPVTSSLSILNKMSSVILIRVVSVEWPEQKADCSPYSNLFSWRYFNSEFATCFSMVLDRIGNADMGRPLYSGVTWPTFHLSGKVLVAIDKFSSLQSVWIKDGAISLRIFALKPSWPVALLTEILLMISATCCGLISSMTKLVVG